MSMREVMVNAIGAIILTICAIVWVICLACC